jgi:hypothetical protein
MLVLTPVLAMAQAAPGAPAGSSGPAGAAGTQAAPPAAAPSADQSKAAPAQEDLNPLTGKPAKMARKMMGAKEHNAENCPCPYCPLKSGAKGASAEQTEQMNMLMNAQLSKDDPAAVLAMRDTLKLTPEQTQQLQQLQTENRQKVESILNADQKTNLAKLPAEATSMKTMHQEMMAKADAGKGGAAGTEEPGAIDKPKENQAKGAAAPEIMQK